jgi:ribosome biogenesis GTPase A|tara:strand:+ start:2828 stop:3583 length:756 start_codon:yes stop_codon:yes gene_type:complete
MGYWPAVMQTIKNADVVIFVLDARLPVLSRNVDLEKKLRVSKKNFLVVFNKIDLISSEKARELQNENKGCFFVSTKNKKGVNNLRFELQKLNKSLKIEKLEVGIVGYPNVGKSAITNVLTRAGKAKVSSKAGTTQGLQWVSGTNIKVLDSPGVIPFEDDEVKLGILGAKNPEKLKDAEKVAIGIIDLFLKSAIRNLELFYKMEVSEEEDSYGIFMKIGEVRKLLKKGGVVDEQRTALMIIKDWQTGKLLLD